MASNRLGRNVVALAASAIAAVYAAGYVHTQAADASLGAPPMTSAAASAQVAAVTTSGPQPTATARQAGSSTRPSGQAAVLTLKDGTCTGVGTSRRGDVQVSLTVLGGRIANVNITGASTQYPTRFIASLPGEVVPHQSAQVDVVSGATYSSLAFRGAVQQALPRARA